MEERGLDEDMGMPNSNSFGYIQHNGREPSSSAVGEQRDIILSRNLDQHYPPPHPSNLREQARRRGRDSDQNQDPGPAIATNSGATSTQNAGGSQLRHPSQLHMTTSAVPTIRYRECLKNHAASMGTHVLDGCGEFMPSGDEGTPEALKCAACDCHRNFHRKEVDGESQSYTNRYHMDNRHREATRRDTAAVPAAIQQLHRYSHGLSLTPSTGPVPMMMAFGAPAESTSEDLDMYRSSGGVHPSGQLAKKRIRTKFTREQKDKMMEFCEKIEWKIPKQDEEQVQRFCSEIGIRRQVFKVWMHNNKQAMKRANVIPDS